jgi:hypothetical protein
MRIGKAGKKERVDLQEGNGCGSGKVKGECNGIAYENEKLLQVNIKMWMKIYF